MSEVFAGKITKIIPYTFTVDHFGLYFTKITASCQSGPQTGSKGGDDLRIEIDGLKLREIPPVNKPQYNNIPPSWNGAQLKGTAKTIIFILKLNKGDHVIKLIPKGEVEVVDFSQEEIKNFQDIQFKLEKQAEDADKRPWVTIVLIYLPLQSIAADVTVAWHFYDGDDVKLIIDNKIEKNNNSLFHKDWVWSASLLQKLFGHQREIKVFTKNLPSGIHYLEFWSDVRPTLHNIVLNLGDITLKRTPTRGDPEWTGNFSDDTDISLLGRLVLGEMEGQSTEAKIGVAFTVLNRLKKQRSTWGYTIHEIVLKESQYDSMWNGNTYNKVRDPFKYVAKKEWYKCYDVASAVFSKQVEDPTSGATHFYSTSAGAGVPSWATDKNFKTKIGITFFYELES